MAVNSDIRDQAYQFFIEEAPELLQVIEEGLLTLREERSTAKVHDLMRAAHSIKGGSASVGLEAIKSLAHRLEDIFKALYSDEVIIDTELESWLLQAYDCLRLPLMEQLETGSFDAEQALATGNALFAQIEERLGDALTQADKYIPSSSDLGVDIVSSIFEVDVTQGLERLSSVVAQPQNYEVAGELRAQAEVFAGFAELLNLSGFGEIAQMALSALEAHPEQALQITLLALADFKAGQEAVLGGDRTTGGSPSPALSELAVAATPAGKTDQGNYTTDETFSSDLEGIFGGEESNIPLLEDVFGGFEVTETETVFEEPHITIPSLEDIFDSSPAPAETEKLPENEEIEAGPETLEEALESVEQQFESLPAIKDSPIPQLKESSQETVTLDTSTETKSNSGVAQDQAKATASRNLSVRVDLERLERMNNLVGELAINRNSLSLQNVQLQEAVRALINRFARFQDMAVQLRDRSDQVLVAPERSGVSQPGELITRQTHFDALEMDSYGALYTLLQELSDQVLQLEESAEDIALFAANSDQTIKQQRMMLTHMRDELMWARMLPLSEVINRFPRVLRDLSTKYNKPVGLKMIGTGVLVDKAVLEKLFDPLQHLLRNAFDHGIEAPDLRRKQGKSEQGQIEIRSYYQGNQTIIEIRDDGNGLNLEKIGRRAIDRGLVSVQQLAVMSESDFYELIFEPGFSTAAQVSELSGRGVGLDVVRGQLRSLKGSVNVTSTPGKGTTFTLRLPLTLTIAKLLVCLVGANALALPSDTIEEIIIPKPEQIKQSGIQKFLHWQGKLIPIHRFADFLDYSYLLPETVTSKALTTVPSPEDWALPLMILRQEEKVLVLEIERLVTEQELVIKPFGAAIAPPKYIYGCTILGDGSLIPVIEPAALTDAVLGQNATLKSTKIGSDVLSAIKDDNASDGKSTAPPKTVQAPTIMAVDDSATMRRTLALTLQKAGYRALQAKDGLDAIKQLEQNPAVQLVICDVEMPNMNGFEFLGQRRKDPKLSEVPVAMLTSRSSDKHRQLAMQLGATAYFTKPYVEQEFLATIKNLIGKGTLALK